ncbi:MAG: YdeI family protein, partial [Thermomicrobiales bacterium]
SILLDMPLTEELKWGKPCYTFDGSNIAIIQGFNHACALMFFKGVLLEDATGLLHDVGKHSRSARRAEFTTVSEIDAAEKDLRKLIDQAIEVEKSGKSVDWENGREIPIPDEFQERIDGDPALKGAFAALTPGRQRGYLLHFASAKQSSTRASRVEKAIPQILEGLGLRD